MAAAKETEAIVTWRIAAKRSGGVEGGKGPGKEPVRWLFRRAEQIGGA